VRQASASTLKTEEGSKQPSENTSDRTERTTTPEGSERTCTIEMAPDSVHVPQHYELDLNDTNNDSDGGDDDDDDDSIDFVAEMEELRHSKSMQKRRGSSSRQKLAHGEFVWVLDDKTHQPARLVLPASELNLNQKYQEGSFDNNSELIEILWTQTALFAWVPKRDILMQKAKSRRAVRKESALDMAVHGAPVAESNSIVQKATVLDATIHTTNSAPTPYNGSISCGSSHFSHKSYTTGTSFDQSASGRRIMKCQDNIIGVVSDDESPLTRRMSHSPASSMSQLSSSNPRKPRRILSLDSSKLRRSSGHNKKKKNTGESIEEVVIDTEQQPIEAPQLKPRRALSLHSSDRKTKKRIIEETSKSTKTPTTLESQTPKVPSRRSSRNLAPKRILSLDSRHKTPPTLEFQTPEAQPKRSLLKRIFTLDSAKFLRKGGKRSTMADNDVQTTPKPTAVMPPIAMPERVFSLDSSTSSKRHAERSSSKGLERKNLLGSASNGSNIDSKISHLMKGSTTRKTPKKSLQAAMEQSPSKRLRKKSKSKSDSKTSETTPNNPTSEQVHELVISCHELVDMLHNLIAPPPEEGPRTPKKPRNRKRLQVESNFKALNSQMIATVGVEASPATSPVTNSATPKSLKQKRRASAQSRQKLKDAFNRMIGTDGSEDNSTSVTSPSSS
jgi:hypothetical protein